MDQIEGPKPASTLIMIRHGESQWNKENLFTGWVDVPLSEKGIEESLKAGELIKDIPIDVIFTSTLVRAEMTALLAMSRHSSGKTPVIIHPGEGRLQSWAKIYSEEAKDRIIPLIKAWELNERMYGALQGLNKAETMERFGKEQVQIWRRSYDVAPPEGESLAMTAKRAIPYFENQVVPVLAEGKNVLVSAHGNSLRAILMDLDALSKDEVIKLEIPTGKPITYQYKSGNFEKQS